MEEQNTNRVNAIGAQLCPLIWVAVQRGYRGRAGLGSSYSGDTSAAS
jgi:hypothetical protein